MPSRALILKLPHIFLSAPPGYSYLSVFILIVSLALHSFFTTAKDFTANIGMH